MFHFSLILSVYVYCSYLIVVDCEQFFQLSFGTHLMSNKTIEIKIKIINLLSELIKINFKYKVLLKKFE